MKQDRSYSIRHIFARDFEIVGCPRSAHHFRTEAKRLLEHTNATYVLVVNREHNSQVRYVPDSDEILIVPSTSGRWGKSRIVRRGASVQEHA